MCGVLLINYCGTFTQFSLKMYKKQISLDEGFG